MQVSALTSKQLTQLALMKGVATTTSRSEVIASLEKAFAIKPEIDPEAQFNGEY